MFGERNCPRCLLSINRERLYANPIVCDSCGHVLSEKQDSVEVGLERSFMWSIVAFSAFTLAAFMHVSTWDQFSGEIIGLKVGETIGTSSMADMERMAQICLELKKYDCTERKLAQLSRQDVRIYARLGKFQMSQRKFTEAADSFRRFFNSGGGDLEANYQFARALGELGKIEEATKHFEYVLASKPDVLQVTVAQNYVKYLVQANRYDRARDVILKLRRKGDSVSSFMDSELKEIQQKFASRT